MWRTGIRGAVSVGSSRAAPRTSAPAASSAGLQRTRDPVPRVCGMDEARVGVPCRVARICRAVRCRKPKPGRPQMSKSVRCVVCKARAGRRGVKRAGHHRQADGREHAHGGGCSPGLRLHRWPHLEVYGLPGCSFRRSPSPSRVRRRARRYGEDSRGGRRAARAGRSRRGARPRRVRYPLLSVSEALDAVDGAGRHLQREGPDEESRDCHCPEIRVEEHRRIRRREQDLSACLCERRGVTSEPTCIPAGPSDCR